MGRRISPYAPERGDIAWADFSPNAGHEQGKRRPVLVLSPLKYNRAFGLMLVCPMSSRVKGLPFEVALPEELSTCGVVLADQVRSFDWRVRRAAFIERAPQTLLDEVLARIAALLEV